MPIVRRVAGRVIRLLSRSPRDEVVRLWALWAGARLRAIRAGGGLTRAPAIMWPQPGRAWIIERDIPFPAAGEVLIRVCASAVSPGTERANFMRLPNTTAQFPMLPGYSVSGEVLAVGRGVTHVRPGDLVAAPAGHASLVLAGHDRTYHVPPEVAAEEAAFVQLGVIALQAWRKAGAELGEAVAVVGQGVVGQLLVQVAAAGGMHPLISVARTGKRITSSLSEVATQIVVTAGNPGGCAGVNAAVTFEATGSPEGTAIALACTRPGGRIVLVGSTRGRVPALDFGLLADQGVTIIGAHVNSLAAVSTRGSAAEEATIFLDLLARRRIDVAGLISERLHPFEAERFYRRLCSERTETVGAVFRWDWLPEVRRGRRVSFFTEPDLTPVRRATARRVRLPVKFPVTESP